MADAVDVEPALTDNRNAKAVEEDDDVKDAEEVHTEPTSLNGHAKDEEEQPKPSKFKELWGKLGLDIGTVMMMFKCVTSNQYSYDPNI